MIEPGNAAEAAPWLEHAHKIFGNEVEYALDWFAQRVQRPAEKPSCHSCLSAIRVLAKTRCWNQ
jgi:hypothetical protein